MEEKIKLLNGIEYDKKYTLEQMKTDSFYYDFLGYNALSFSSLSKILESPKSYVKSLLNTIDTPALQFGRLFHKMILEPRSLIDLNLSSGARTSKEYKDMVREFGVSNVYLDSDFSLCADLAREIQNNKYIVTLIEGSQYEVPQIKLIQGIPIRGKADILAFDCVIDLKTTSDINSFRYSAKKYNYDLQAVIYLDLFDVSEFKFIVVDKTTGDLGIFECSQDFLDSGYEKLYKGIDIYNKYFQNGDYKDYIVRGIL